MRPISLVSIRYQILVLLPPKPADAVLFMTVSNESTERTPRRTETALMQLFDTRTHLGQVSLTREEAIAIHRFLQKAHPDLFGPTRFVSTDTRSIS